MFHFSMDTARSVGTLSLTGDLTIRNAAEFKEAVANAMDQTQQLELNLSEVERIDLTTLQILCAAHRTMLKKGRTLTISGAIPPALRETMQQAGFVDCGGEKETSGLWKGVSN
ncbi:MAG: STAS domain-containing protein [Magnetococcales bacterium]|jgi:anti-anti-sigma factor|nr:STAS domain-containing protein [Magnetococcales bacterium]